jgi:hypothetical protein
MIVDGERLTVARLANMVNANHLKTKARALYLRIAREQERITCGAHLQDIIAPRIAADIAELHRILTRLAEIDPAARAMIDKNGLPFTGGNHGRTGIHEQS